ncbi:MAG: hypothetical protein V4436_01375 [Patescibacteria group bacterium]
MLLDKGDHSLVVRTYKYWALVLHRKQLPYYGRCYLWWMDKEAHEGENFSYATLPLTAHTEAGLIARDLLTIWKRLGYPTLPYGQHFRFESYCCPNQEDNFHMRIDVVPRLKAPTTFVSRADGTQVQGFAWGRNYVDVSKEHEREVPFAQLLRIRDEMQESLF